MTFRWFVNICNVLWNDNAGFLYDLIARIIYKLCDSSVLESNISQEDNDNSDIETGSNIENISSSKMNDANSENNLRNYFGNTKNKMAASYSWCFTQIFYYL